MEIEILPSALIAEVQYERCVELASEAKLYEHDWIEITGIGTGCHNFYRIDSKGVMLQCWPDDLIRLAPLTMQIDMLRDNLAPRQYLTSPVRRSSLLHSLIARLEITPSPYRMRFG